MLAGGGALAMLALSSQQALAVPSFARQTGLPCEVCHTVFPELTPFGRLFKLNGYTLTGLKQIEAAGGKGLKINAGAPLSVMVMTGVTHENKVAAGSQNNNAEFPQQLSLFYAGEISPHMGSFLQVTYDQASGTFGDDNTDIRYANHFTMGGQDQIYGVTLNNNPSLEDVWNDTPAWAFPWISSDQPSYDSANVPGAVVGSLGQNVVGLGAYTLLYNQWYAALSFYRTAAQGTGSVATPVGAGGGTLVDTLDSINGLAPYWRLAWQHQFNNAYWEIGTFGMQTRGLDIVGLTDKYTDVGADTQLEIPMGVDLLALHAQYVRENQDYGAYGATAVGQPVAPANPNDHLTGVHLDAAMHWSHDYELVLAYDNWSGNPDTGLYAWTNSASGSPDTAYWTAQVAYLPWENTQLGLQYRGYTKFVGSTTSVSNDNFTYLYGWFAW